MLDEFALVFVPMFVAVDPVGILPIFMTLTEGMDAPRRRRVIFTSVSTALVVSLGFLALGKLVLGMLSVTLNDFRVAGGALLFVIALGDLMSPQKGRHRSPVADETVGAVPLGVPLIVGPAVLTTSLVLVDSHAAWLVVASVVLNVLIAGGTRSCVSSAAPARAWSASWLD
jgi:multiple antibiotic resistance protein